MPACTNGEGAGCRKPISGIDMKKARKITDPTTGKLKGVMHARCWFTWQKKFRPDVNERGRYYDGPGAYDMRTGEGLKRKSDLTDEELARRETVEKEYVALLERQKEIAAQRGLEERPDSFADWRDPEELELDELLEATEKLKSSDT